jgi:ribosomal protein S18 acetylase RimI-like enzyme
MASKEPEPARPAATGRRARGSKGDGSATVRRAASADVEPMAAQLCRSFFDDPVMEYVFRNERRRTQGMQRYFTSQMRGDYLAFGGCYTTDDYRGAAIWAPAGKPLLTGMAGIANLVRALPYVASHLPTTLKMISLIESMHPHEPHWYLATLGTDPEAQGRGIGSALMRPALDYCDAEARPAYLESSKERNISFYNRHGFEVVREVAFPRGGPKVWTMWRQPKGPPAGGAG